MARASRFPPARSELLALLATARRNPLSETPRLIVADWLEEHGDESDRNRATFIRLQCELSQSEHIGRRRRRLTEAEQCLLQKWENAWLGGLAEIEDKEVGYTRGLIDLQIDAPTLLQRGLRNVLATEQAAWVDEVRLTKINRALLERFVQMPFATSIGGLILNNAGLDANDCQIIAASEKLTHLHTLDMNYNRIGNEGVIALSGSKHLGNLHHLDLWICGIEAEGAHALAAMRSEARPYWLNLGGNNIGEEGMRALARSPLLEKVQRLLLWGNSIGNTGLAHLVRGPYLQHIEELYLNENGLSMRGARALAQWEPLNRIRTLSIWRNRLRPRGGAILASAPMSQMRMLLLSMNNISDEGVIALASNPTLRNLHSLDLSRNRITDQGVAELLDSPYLVSLRNLDLRENTISPALMNACEARYEMVVRDEVP